MLLSISCKSDAQLSPKFCNAFREIPRLGLKRQESLRLQLAYSVTVGGQAQGIQVLLELEICLLTGGTRVYSLKSADELESHKE